MNAGQASGTAGSCDSVLGLPVSGVVCSLTPATVRRGPSRIRSDGLVRIGFRPCPSARRDSVAFTVVVTVLVCLGALPILVVIALSGAPGSMVLATVLAALPVGPLVGCYLWLDRYEPEPKSAAGHGLALGRFRRDRGGAAAAGARRLVRAASPTTQSLAVVAPVTEEASKGLFLFLLLWWRRAELDGILDGIVYAGMVGIGFAFIENILYLAAAYNGTDGDGSGRRVGASPAPSSCAACSARSRTRCSPTFIGIGVGVAVMSRRRWVKVAGAARRLPPGRRRPRGVERLHPVGFGRASSGSTSC